MAEDKTPQQEIERWKQKYFAVLGEKDSVDKSLAEGEAQLRRSLSHLSLATDGIHPAMDPLLRELRNAIRDGKPSAALPPLVEQVLEISSKLGQGAAAKPSAPAQDILLELLDSLRLPRGMQRKVKALRNRLRQDGDSQATSALVTQLSGLIDEALALQAGVAGIHAEESPQPGFFTRLLGNRPDKGDAMASSPASDGGAPRREPSRETGHDHDDLVALLNKIHLPGTEQTRHLLELRQRLEQAPVQKEIPEIIDQLSALLSRTHQHHTGTYSPDEVAMIQDVLCQLLERLNLPTQFHADLTRICEHLQEELEPQALMPLLEEIARIIDKAHTLSEEEKAELEGFLKNITQSLLEIDQHLLGTKQVSQQVMEGSRRLDVSMEEQVQGIEASVLAATDLPELRKIIESRLSAIRTHLEQFRTDEEQRFAQLDQEFDQLRSHLADVEQESIHLRHKILEQHQQALRDPLTGISNRLAYNERIHQEYQRWKRYRDELTLLVWDIDNFKAINDRFGHHAGDKALRIIATLLSKNIRTTDFVARYGGEEFVMLMPNTTLESALPAADNLRITIAQSDFTYNGIRVPITISCGLAQFRDEDTEDDVFKRADGALYQAKHAGRDKCLTERDIVTE